MEEEGGNAEGEDEGEAAAKEGRKSSSDKSGVRNAWLVEPLCFSSKGLLELDCQLDDDWSVSGPNGSGDFEEDPSTGAVWLADTSNAGTRWEEAATAAAGGWVGR